MCLAQGHNVVLPVRLEPATHSFLASCDFYHLLLTFANNLNPDQYQQTIGSDLDPNRLTL